jgi:hypothetical protein
VIVLALVVLGLIVVLVAVTALPRWWAQRVGDQVDGDLTNGLVIGFSYGFLATLLPLAVLALVARFFRRSWLAWLVGIGVAVVLAAPNLLTLWIVVGAGSGAHAGDRTLDVIAPWFRGGMLFGVIAGLAVVVYVLFVVASRRRAREKVDRLRGERDEARAAAAGQSLGEPPRELLPGEPVPDETSPDETSPDETSPGEPEPGGPPPA